MIVIGVTGGIGSGKSEVARLFARHGALVIDADRVGHDLLKGAGPAVKAVGRVFGRDLVTPQGIDRRRLAEVVFADRGKLQELTDILYPRIGREIRSLLRRGKKNPFAVVDAAVLIEAGWYKEVDAVVLVRATREQQIRRAARRLGIGRAEVLARIRRQMPFSGKLKFADFVVDNRGALSGTDKQVDAIVRSLQK